MHLDAAVAAQEDMRQMVEQLEIQQTDEAESIPTGDELASRSSGTCGAGRRDPIG